MIEVLWHGRGGQGAFTAARLLGAAASLAEGRFALAFPSFGPERRGAPMRAFTKLDDRPIGDRSASAQADFVVYLDETLLGGAWESELKPEGMVLVNSTRQYGDPRIVSVDASGISASVLGRPIPNTAFLGALAALSGRVDVEDVREAVRLYMPERLRERNIAIVDAVYRQMQGQCGAAGGAAPQASQGAVGAPAPQASQGGAPQAPQAGAPDVLQASQGGVPGILQAPASSDSQAPQGDAPQGNAPCGDAPRAAAAQELGASSPASASASAAQLAPQRRPASIPTLRAAIPQPDDYARTTCFEAGHLVAKNAGWRNVRPVIDAGKCTGCLQCYLHCPDGTVFKCAPAAPASTEQTFLRNSLVANDKEAGAGGELSNGTAGKAAVMSPAAAPVPQTLVVPAPVAIDYDFCKGCGICARVCAFGAIAMVPERGEGKEGLQ